MKLGVDFLNEVGLAEMPEEQKQVFLDYVQEELEMRVGERVSEGMSNEKMMEFDEITDKDEAVDWLNTNRPDYVDIVYAEVKKIKDEVRQNREQILA